MVIAQQLHTIVLVAIIYQQTSLDIVIAMVAGVVKHLCAMVLKLYDHTIIIIYVALDCGPPELDNGDTDFNSTTFLSEANYTCDEGYYPSSFMSISTCEADGAWSELLCISKDYVNYLLIAPYGRLF